MKELIRRDSATTLRELIDLLNELAELYTDEDHTQDSIYTSINSDSIKTALIKETLSDGSTVYNIEFSPVTETVCHMCEHSLEDHTGGKCWNGSGNGNQCSCVQS